MGRLSPPVRKASRRILAPHLGSGHRKIGTGLRTLRKSMKNLGVSPAGAFACRS